MVTVLSSIKITFISREETIEREGEGESEDFRDRSFSMPGIREEWVKGVPKYFAWLSICAETKYNNGREQPKIARHIMPSLL